MANKLGQGGVQVQKQKQKQTQTQKLTQQQVLLVRLTELPVNDLCERINKELEDNPWLQGERPEGFEGTEIPEYGDGETNESNASPEAEEASEGPTYDYDDGDDGIPRDPNADTENARQHEIGDTSESLTGHLEAQLGEYNLTEHEQKVMKYLIGSLADDGLLYDSLQVITDELNIYQNVQTSVEELEHLLVDVLQQMEPAGVGARDLRECLTIQAQRNYKGDVRDQMVSLFQRYWDDFSHLRWHRIQQSLKLDDMELERLRKKVRRLNPRPGGSIGGDHSDNHQITPDFFVECDENGNIHLTLNEGDIPRLVVSPDAEQELKMPVVSKSDREAMRYLHTQIGQAKMFIDAIAQRRKTMLETMKAIIRIQRPFFLEGDETLLKPMKLEDVANQTGQDISTVSRVANSKYVLTTYGIYPLRWFFTSATRQNGDDVTVRKVLQALKETVDAEDKHHPLSDERLVVLLREKGYDVARRTVAKYRQHLNISESRLRKA